MWTDIFKLRWKIPLPGKGYIEVSLKLPHFGLPPHAFVDYKSDPLVHELKSATWTEVYRSETLSATHGYGYIADERCITGNCITKIPFGEGEQFI